MNAPIPPDAYAQRAKQLTATLNRLRGRVGTDESKTPELADALLDLTGHRLLGHEFAEAATGAQESVALAARLLASHGPLGPYTPADAATRIVTAMVYLATVQTEAGRVEDAAQSLVSADTVLAAMRTHAVNVVVPAEARAWEGIARARTALAEDDPADANARIDAVAVAPEFQELDRLQTLAAARWAAGALDQSVAAAWQAAERYERDYAPIVLARGIAPARLARLTQPLTAVYADLADRLAALGDLEAAITTRRTLADRLGALAEQRGRQGAAEWAAARRALADDLAMVGREHEAAQLMAAPGVQAAPSRPGLEAPETSISWVGASSELADAAARAEAARAAAVRAEREHAEAVERERRVRAEREAERIEAERRAAEERAQAEREAAELAEAEREAATQAAIAESQRQRAQRIADHERAQREQQAELLAAAHQAVDELESARSRLAAARAVGDRQAAYAAAQAVVVELRGRFTSDASVAPELIDALNDLATSQRQAGDWWGSRRPAKEAKELTKRWTRG